MAVLTHCTLCVQWIITVSMTPRAAVQATTHCKQEESNKESYGLNYPGPLLLTFRWTGVLPLVISVFSDTPLFCEISSKSYKQQTNKEIE